MSYTCHLKKDWPTKETSDSYIPATINLVNLFFSTQKNNSHSFYVSEIKVNRKTPFEVNCLVTAKQLFLLKGTYALRLYMKTGKTKKIL